MCVIAFSFSVSSYRKINIEAPPSHSSWNVEAKSWRVTFNITLLRWSHTCLTGFISGHLNFFEYTLPAAMFSTFNMRFSRKLSSWKKIFAKGTRIDRNQLLWQKRLDSSKPSSTNYHSTEQIRKKDVAPRCQNPIPVFSNQVEMWIFISS